LFTFGVDVDGVIRDWQSALRTAWNAETGQNIQADAQTWPLKDTFRHETVDVRELAFGKAAIQICREATPVAGACAVLRALYEHGIRIHYITAQPRSGQRATVEWLLNHDFPMDGISFVSTQMSKADVPADVYIDDGPPFLQQLIGAGKDVLIYDHPYNRDVCGGQRVADWSEVFAAVIFRYSMWSV
jgi:5'(3')-deoxyribonucleotidase